MSKSTPDQPDRGPKWQRYALKNPEPDKLGRLLRVFSCFAQSLVKITPPQLRSPQRVSAYTRSTRN